MPHFSDAHQKALAVLAADLDHIFGARLHSLVAYPGNQADGSLHSCAIVDDLGFRDLVSCLPQTDSWHHRGIAVPLMLATGELERTIDIFPLEYASILANYVVVRGPDPFHGVSISVEDVRRATEGQAKSHLIHLREAFLESHGETTRIGRLIASSAAPLRALLTNIGRFPDSAADTISAASPTDESLAKMAEARMGVSGALIREILASSSAGQSTIADPSALLARYIDAAQKIWEYVDRWRS